MRRGEVRWVELKCRCVKRPESAQCYPSLAPGLRREVVGLRVGPDRLSVPVRLVDHQARLEARRAPSSRASPRRAAQVARACRGCGVAVARLSGGEKHGSHRAAAAEADGVHGRRDSTECVKKRKTRPERAATRVDHELDRLARRGRLEPQQTLDQRVGRVVCHISEKEDTAVREVGGVEFAIGLRRSRFARGIGRRGVS